MGIQNNKTEHSIGEVFQWLKSLPLAPEYHPTIQEFQDPISFVCKIEKVASNFGICKIVPPVAGQSKKVVISNLSKSVGLRNPRLGPTFATRVQEVGFNARNQRPVERNVWESGEECTFQEFKAKAKGFEKKWLKKGKRVISPLEVESLFWKVNGGSPFLVEYASDVVGSCFSTLKERKTGEGVVEGGSFSVGDSGWNMRGVARANGSLLRFMKEDIDGVSSPMVYLAMLFSWFGWHVEDHDLHSLNYLHFGASKTWYSVPSDAAAAFEEVVRVHGFGEEINPLVTFAKLREKTTVMSPEVLINTGVPCCRLVQNAGEFVVTFPRAYHCGFSHGFNCSEASNIATPEWLRFAKDAAIRRASINYPPMVSHFQLLYDFALALCSRDSTGTGNEPRSSRLKDKKKGEGVTLVKQMFVEDVMKNNDLLFTLGQGSDVVLLPHNLSEKFVWSNLHVGSKCKVKSGLPFSLYSSEEAMKASDDLMLARSSNSFKWKSTSVSQNSAMPSQSSSGSMCTSQHDIQHSDTEKEGCAPQDGLSNRGLFSCVKCGIWTFACVAIVQPTESAAHYLMSADCSFLQELATGSGLSSQGVDLTGANHSDPDTFSGSSKKNAPDDLDHEVQSIDDAPMKSATAKSINMDSYDEKSSALGLLAMAYGISSDSDELDELSNRPIDDYVSGDDSSNDRFHHDRSVSPSSQQGYDSEIKDSPRRIDFRGYPESRRANSDDSEHEAHDYSAKFREEDTMTSRQVYSPMTDENDTGKISNGNDPVDKQNFPFFHGCDEDSSRMHMFCLEHAIEVEKILRPIGGVHILLLCHPDYPKVQIEAKKVAEELKMDRVWNDTAFSEATKDDEEQILLALRSEEATPKNEDWAVKLGINLFYSATLSHSPLYNKQMPYNSVIYSAFGCNSPSKSSPESVARGKPVGRQKKIVVAGKWCGKVWMSNQVHPLLVQRDVDVEERNVFYCSNPYEKSATKTETKRAQASSARQKIPRKRKPTQFKALKKMKLETEEFACSDHDDSVEDKPAFVPRRSMRKTKSVYRRTKEDNHQEEIPGVGSEDDSLDDKRIRGPLRSCGPLRSAAGKLTQLMKGQPSGSMDGSSDDSLDDLSHIEQRTSRRTFKVMGKPTRKLKSRKEEMMDSELESSSDDEFEENNSRTRSLRLEVGTSEWCVPGEFEPISDDEVEGGSSTRLRNRRVRSLQESETKSPVKRQVRNSKAQKALPSTRNGPARKGPRMRLPTRTPAMKEPAQEYYDSSDDNQEEEAEFRCDIEGCNMSLDSKQDFAMHKKNVCHVKGCGKKFFSHKYMVPHQRVHVDDRPLKCPWKGCKMSFKWAWARTEHIRVHTGARPYVCKEPGCGQTFRFVSDFSRHKRKTGHSVKKAKK